MKLSDHPHAVFIGLIVFIATGLIFLLHAGHRADIQAQQHLGEQRDIWKNDGLVRVINVQTHEGQYVASIFADFLVENRCPFAIRRLIIACRHQVDGRWIETQSYIPVGIDAGKQERFENIDLKVLPKRPTNSICTVAKAE